MQGISDGVEASGILTPVRRLGAPAPTPSPKAKQAVVVMNIRCPLCHAWWIFEFLATIAKMSDVPGSYKGVFAGNEFWRIETTMWGQHALCGECSAKHRAFMVPEGLFRVPARVWTESDEKTMWGRLKGQQQDYAALLRARPHDGKPMQDDQKNVRERILQKGSIVISRERCKNLKLGWGTVE